MNETHPPSVRRGIGLRGRIILLNVSLILFVTISMSSYFIARNQDDLRSQVEETARAVRLELGKKGMAIARSVARASERALATGNYSFLMEAVRAAVDADPELTYGVIMDSQGRAAVHTDRTLAGKTLGDPSSAFAAAQKTDTTQTLVVDGVPSVEAISPILIDGSQWGVVRLGLSLAHVEERLGESVTALRSKTLTQIAVVIAAAVALALLGIALAAYVVRRTIAPLGDLLAGVKRVTDGDLSHRVNVRSVPEFVNLSVAFNAMTAAVRERETELQDALAELERALAAAEEANRLKTEFLANISHEIRTPLNAMLNVPAVALDDFQELLLWVCGGCGNAFEPSESDAEKPQPESRARRAEQP